MRLPFAFVRLALRVDATRLATEIEALPPSAWRAHPEGAAGNTAVPLVAAGGDPDDDAASGPMRPTPTLDLLPYHREVLAALEAPIGRTRLMALAGEGRLDAHADTNRYWQDHLRVHVPVVTDPAVRFTCDDDAVHMAAGEVWVFDTWRRHGVDNPVGTRRVHLVIDTVGSSRLWSRIDAGAEHGREGPATGPVVGPVADAAPAVAFESVNAPAVTSPWQHAAHAADLLADLGPHADDQLRRRLRDFVIDWRALWARHGDQAAGRADFAALAADLDRWADTLPRFALPNGTAVAEAIRQLLIRPALRPIAPTAAPARLGPGGRARPPKRRIERPVFVVSAPRTGSSLLFECLARAADVHTIGGESHEVIESIDPLHPVHRGWASNALTAADATPEVVSRLEDAFIARARDRDGRPPRGAEPVRLLEKTPKNALRVPFLAAAFPDAVFVYLHRSPLPTVSSMLDAWRSGRFVTYPQLPGWPGPAWSLLLVPDWQGLVGRSLPEVVARQWAATVTALLDDLEALGPERWCVADHDELVAAPNAELGRLCELLGLEWDRPVIGPPPPSRTTLDAPAADKWHRNRSALEPLHELIEPVGDRAAAFAATGRSRPVRPLAPVVPALPAEPPASDPAVAGTEPSGDAPFASVHTSTVGELLAHTGSSVIVTTYQTGRVLLLRADGEGRVNTHLRAFPRPMGVAVAPGRLAIGTDQAIWELRDQPAVARRLEPPGRHDACFVPRSAHVTGDIAVHELAWIDDQLWMVNTRFSCLATLDADHSFVPRWRPAFVTELTTEDRCHLNGFAIVDGRPKYVTALAMSDEPQGWRREKVGGGVVLDVDSGAVVAHGLAMPHSPRWHRGRLWVLDSGRGHLSVVDLDTGSVDPFVRLPGFTRGLAFVGRYALVGLSKVREHVFAGLPLAEHLEERRCGVWIVDLETAAVVGFLRFDGLVEEVFDVQVLPGVRYPELVEPGDPLAAGAFVLPAEG